MRSALVGCIYCMWYEGWCCVALSGTGPYLSATNRTQVKLNSHCYGEWELVWIGYCTYNLGHRCCYVCLCHNLCQMVWRRASNWSGGEWQYRLWSDMSLDPLVGCSETYSISPHIFLFALRINATAKNFCWTLCMVMAELTFCSAARIEDRSMIFASNSSTRSLALSYLL